MPDIINELKKRSNLRISKITSGFFKTGKGEYAEKDKFLGIRVPEIRKVCKDYPVHDLKDIKKMLQNGFHEIRFAALISLRLLNEKAKNKDSKLKIKSYYNFYIKNVRKINNWDLVDISAPYIVGNYLLDNKQERKVLFELADSDNVWERRVAIVSTLILIKNNEFTELKKISKKFFNDKHDLIHKATGWMLREMGKVDESSLIMFLDKNYKKMPRTMLRYSIEKLNKQNKQKYLL